MLGRKRYAYFAYHTTIAILCAMATSAIEHYQTAYLTFLERLRAARLDKGLTQMQAAALLGRDQYWLSRCETGARRVDVVELLLFARIYEKPLTFFTRNLIADS
jgi:hypothetical protein